MKVAEMSGMGEVEREFAYKTSDGQLLLIGIVLALFGVSTAYMGMQAEPGLTYIRKVGYLTQGQVAVLGWMVGILSLLIGLKMTSVAFPKALKRKRIAFLGSALAYPDPATGNETALDYGEISQPVVLKEGGQQVLRFTTPTGNVRLYPAGLKSAAEFEELCTLLKERTRRHG